MFADEAEANNEGESAEETPAGNDEAASEKGSETDILNSPVFLQRKLDVIKSDIEKTDEAIENAKAKLEENKAEWEPQVKSLEAEFQAIQNRFSTQGSQSENTAIIDVARKMLEVLDIYDRAFQSLKAETAKDEEIEAKYKATYNKVLATFDDLGIVEVKALGKEFDYDYHQAVLQRPSDDYEEGIVCDELQKGYMLGSKLIRAAMVAVAA